MGGMKDAFKSGGAKREYRDHRLEWLVKSGGIQVEGWECAVFVAGGCLELSASPALQVFLKGVETSLLSILNGASMTCLDHSVR
jgi:hypothetical protein